jgi:hypothetical protein
LGVRAEHAWFCSLAIPTRPGQPGSKIEFKLPRSIERAHTGFRKQFSRLAFTGRLLYPLGRMLHQPNNIFAGTMISRHGLLEARPASGEGVLREQPSSYRAQGEQTE